MTDKKEQNLLDWIGMSTTEIVVADANKGGLHDQLERLYMANECRIGMQEVRFVNCLHSEHSTETLLKLVKQICDVKGDDTIRYPLSDIPYGYWTYDMLIIHGEIKAIYHQNELIETILEQNKPSLLAEGGLE